MSELSLFKSKLNQAEGARGALLADISSTKDSIAKLATDLEVVERAQVVLQLTAKQTQEQLQFHLQDMVQAAIDTVFAGVYKFRADFLPKAGGVECDLYLLKDESRVDPMHSSGGGVVDVVAFALRLVAWSIGKSDNTIVLDEPFKFLSVGLRPIAGELLRGLSKELGLQLIYVTHDPELVGAADRIFEVTQTDGISKVVAKEGTLQYE